MNFDLLLKGGEVFTGGALVTADVGVRDGLIVAIGRYLASDRLCPVYDVRGKWVLPSFVELFAQGDDVLALSQRAAAGGASLLVSVVTPKPWESPDQTCRRVGQGESWIDRAFAVRVLAGQLPTHDGLLEAKRSGLAYLLASLSPRTDGLGLEDTELFALLSRAKNAGVSVCVSLEHTGFAQDPPGELVQAARALALAQAAATRVGLCGVTLAETLLAAGRSPTLVFSHSLLLSSAFYARRRGRFYRAQPPLRPKDLLKPFQARVLRAPQAMVAFGGGLPVAALKPWKSPDVAATPLPALPAGAQAVLGRLVPKKGATAKHLQRLVRLLSASPFAFTGHASERGVLSIGAVADLVVLDPARARLGPPRPKTSEEHNPFMRQPALALPAFVLNRGRVVAEAGVLKGDAPHGTIAVPFSQR